MEECNEFRNLKGRSFGDYSAGHRRMYEAGLVCLDGSSASVLDIGSGIGWGFKRSREMGHVGPWVGVEPCEDSYVYCRDNRPGATWHHATLGTAIVSPATFVFCVEVIEHVEKGEAAAFLARVRELCLGTLYLSTPESDRHHHGTFTRGEMVAALKAAGFRDVVVNSEQWTTLYVAQ